MLAFVFAATGSVTACWVAHAVHNAISLWVMLGSVPGPTEPQEITTAGLEPGRGFGTGHVFDGKISSVQREKPYTGRRVRAHLT